MKNKIFLGLNIILLFVIGCQSNITKSSESLSDSELIYAIINADKIDISMNEMPLESRNTIDEIIDYEGIETKIAIGLGYEVSMAGVGHRSGHRSEVYFNLEGRKLILKNEWGRDEWGNFDREKYHDLDYKCFDLVYPVSFIMPDGTVLEVSADTEYGWASIKGWYDENPENYERPTIQFPIQILLDYNEALTVNNNDEMKNVYKSCRRDDNDWDRDENLDRGCFNLVYPITYLMPDGIELIVNEDTESGWSEVKAWYEANPDSDQKPELQYPVDIIFETEDGDQVLTINNEEEMWEAKERCRGHEEGEDWDEGDEEGSCFEFDYPITYIMPDGTEISIASEEDTDGWMAIRNWYINNPETEEEPSLQYPIDIIFETEDGDVVMTISSDNEMSEFEEEFCREESDEG